MTNFDKLKITNDLLIRMQRELVRLSLPNKIRVELADQIMQLNDLLTDMSQKVESELWKERKRI
jgi:hypothetical protein